MPTIPDTPAGKQLAWYLDRVASAGEGATMADRDHFAPRLSSARWVPTRDDVRESWRRLLAHVGEFEITSVEEEGDLALSVTVGPADRKRWRVSCRVEEQESHRISDIFWERQFDFDVTVREATEADAAVLAEIERRCPITLGDRSITFDRGDDYFAFARLMEDVTVGLGFADGVPAAINCGGRVTAEQRGVPSTERADRRSWPSTPCRRAC